MSVQDLHQPHAPGSSGERSAAQYSAYRQSGPMDSALLNGRHGSHGYVSSDPVDDHAPLFPHQPSFLADHTNNAASAAVSLERKRRAEEADVAVIDLTGDSPPSKRQRPSATPKRTRKYNVSDTESDERNGIRYKELNSNATKHNTSRARTGAEEQPKRIANIPGKRRSKDADKAAQSHGAEDAGEEPKKKKAKQDGEKRLRRWRAHAPSAYQEIRNRALTQRMFALDRSRSNENPQHPSETISLAGTTGNVYTICIDKVPTCNCPHAKKGNQCKHVVYVLSRVLRAPSELEYQLAFTSSELRDIFANAPPLPSETASSDAQDGNRKPVEGECPICCNDFERGSSETIVYCKAACGNNIHKDCFAQWAATKRGQTITCPFCRSPWQDDEANPPEIAKGASRNAEGYVNVASQLGLSGRRDYSTYNSFWVRGQARRGRIAWDEDGVMEHEY